MPAGRHRFNTIRHLCGRAPAGSVHPPKPLPQPISLMSPTTDSSVAHILHGIADRVEHGVVILGPTQLRAHRRLLYVNSYGGIDVWRKIRAGLLPTHHLWGCVQLARMGYEVALAEAIPDFDYRRRPLPHDLRLYKLVRHWLRNDDIVYCAHNVLYWLPFLRKLRLFRRHFVSLLFAHENLDFSECHSAVVALTPTAAHQAARLAPKAKIAHLGWGADLDFYPYRPYRAEYLLHCGIAGRDFPTLSKAAFQCHHPIRIVASQNLTSISWPKNVQVVDGGRGYNHEDKKVSFPELINEHYAGAAASLIVTISNPKKDHALGFTNLIEAMALGKPIIHTHTGALADEIEVQQRGCGLSIPPGDPIALAQAMNTIMSDPEMAATMGQKARQLSESHYNIARFSGELDRLFTSL